MKQFLKCDGFYQDPNALQSLIQNLEFEDTLYGKEIPDFYYIPQGLQEFIGSVLNEQIQIQPDTGIFRRPNQLIHFDNFYEHALWTCVVAVEDTAVNLHTHRDGHETFFDVGSNVEEFFLSEAMNQDAWSINTSIKLRKNQFLFIRPWVWRSYDAEKILQTFLINAKLGQ